jgi:hypothetical protein
MTASRENLGLPLGFIGMCMFAGTLATRLALPGFDPSACALHAASLLIPRRPGHHNALNERHGIIKDDAHHREQHQRSECKRGARLRR